MGVSEVLRMTPSEIRKELLEQHAQLRAEIDATRAAAKQWQQQEAAREALRSAMAVLADGVRQHNRREEELLQEIIPTADAWGPARAEVMREEHVEEHKAMYEALIDAGAAPSASVGVPPVLKLLDKMEEHMKREEKAFLGADVLRDDAVTPDFFGG
jgi:DNA repair exonuclease SbcCD ATPase subunit